MPLSSRKSVRNDQIFAALFSREKGKDPNSNKTQLTQSLIARQNNTRTQGARILATQRLGTSTTPPTTEHNTVVDTNTPKTENFHRRRSILYSNPEHSLRSGDYSTESHISPPPSKPTVVLEDSITDDYLPDSPTDSGNIRSLSSIDSKLLNTDSSTIKAYIDEINSERAESNLNESWPTRTTDLNREGASTGRVRRYSSIRTPPTSTKDDNLSSLVSPKEDSVRRVRMSSVSVPRKNENDTDKKKPSTTQANYNPIGSNLFKSTYSSTNYQRNKK
jgi:hypothetical protein